jgi:hypothetical protein
VSLIAKTGQPLSEGEFMVVDEKVAVGTPLCIGSEVFVWTAETQGGEGLAAMGGVEGVGRADDDRRRSIAIRLSQRSPTQALGKAELVTHDSRVNAASADTVLSRLSAKLYGHSHNRVVALEDDEAAFLRQRFL